MITRKEIVMLCALSVCLLALQSCASGIMIAGALERKTEITVVDEAGTPIEGVRNAVAPPFSTNPTSDRNGRIKIPNSVRRILLAKEGYSPQEIDFQNQTTVILREIER